MKYFLFTLVLAAGAWASVVEKRPYIPDENHLPPFVKGMEIRQAQEEAPSGRKSSSTQKAQRKIKIEHYKKTELAE